MIRLFDIRAAIDKGTEAFESRFRGSKKSPGRAAVPHSSIMHLRHIRDWEVLVAAHQGEVRKKCVVRLRKALLTLFFLS